jgi:hypothetical protein
VNIEPIRLLSGSHADTGTTGQGCFMNVVAYLNGEPQITDQSPCVCVYVRPLAIRLNDCASDEQRQRMLPFVLRAMGSATEDKAVMHSRRARLRQYGAECDALMQAFKADQKAKNPRYYATANANANAYAYAYANANANANANAYANANANAYANANANANADAYANAYANAYADAYAYAYANAYANAYAAKLKADLFDAGMRYLDDVLPPADATFAPDVVERAARLVELAA